MSSDVPKGAKFFVKIAAWNSDDTLGVDCEGLTARLAVETATDDALEEVENNGGEVYVYECRAVRKVVRGKTRVINIVK